MRLFIYFMSNKLIEGKKSTGCSGNNGCTSLLPFCLTYFRDCKKPETVCSSPSAQTLELAAAFGIYRGGLIFLNFFSNFYIFKQAVYLQAIKVQFIGYFTTLIVFLNYINTVYVKFQQCDVIQRY